MFTISAASSGGQSNAVTMDTRATANGNVLNAMIYRGKNACKGCPESVEDLLEEAYPNAIITYAGPDEPVKINAETLGCMDVFAYGGGPDLDDAWDEAKAFAPAVRDFVHNGGSYLGFCLGAYLAGHDPGFDLTPDGDLAVQEIERKDAQVDDEDDTVIQVDWTFSTGSKKGTTERKRWMYFQDGAAFTLAKNSPAKILGRYSSNGDVAAILNSYGQGWVANVGPHPEADQDWYDDEGIKNPEGVKTDIGEDFVRAAINAS